jgi:putative ABC transport system permease protein
MSLLELLRLAVQNLLRMRARVAMTALGVVIGTAAVVILMSLGEGLQRESLRGIEQMGSLTEVQVYPNFGGPSAPGAPALPGGRAVLNEKTLTQMRAIEGVQGVIPFFRPDQTGEIKVNRLQGYPGNFVGLPPDQVASMGFEVPTGTARLGSGQVIIGARVGEQFFDPLNPPKFEPNKPFVPVRHDLFGRTLAMKLIKTGEDGKSIERVVKFRVVGVIKESGGERDGTIYAALNDVMDINQFFSGRRPNLARDGYQQVIVRTKSVNEAEQVSVRIKELGFSTFSPLEIIKQVRQTFAVVQAVLGGIGAIALLVAAFGIANTMVMAIYERTREIGLMKAVGASDRDVLLVFLVEAAAIGLLGGIFGVLVGWLGGEAVGGLLSGVLTQGAPPGQAPPDVVIMPGWLPAFAIAFATLIGLLSGLYPAVRATRLDPIVALRQQ